LGSWWSSSQGLLPLSSLEEAIVLPKLKSTPDRTCSKQKHNKKTIYRPRVLRGVIWAKIIHRGEITGGNWDGKKFRGDLTLGQRG
jgi:hypothetical protein